MIRFGVEKPVPVNLLMTAIIIAGLFCANMLRREFFPESDPDQATVTMPYPGATPDEIEDTLAKKVEDKLIELDEVKELRTTLSEGGGGIVVEFREGLDADEAVEEVERSVDSLLDLPDESERIQVRLFEPRMPVIRVVLSGEVDEKVMKETLRAVRDDLRSLPRMGETLVEGVRDYKIRVDVSREAMLRQGLSLPEVSQTVGNWMRENPGGTVRTSTGDVKIRTMGVAERADRIRQIPLVTDERGRMIRVGDVARISENFVDAQIITRFNGKPAAALTVFKVGEQDIVNMAEMVRAYVSGRNGEPFEPSVTEGVLKRVGTSSAKRGDDTGWWKSDRYRAWELGSQSLQPLPAGVNITTNTDLARFVEGRLELLTRNALFGAVLVFATLLVFLNWRVALWVGVGLVTAILGTIMLMYTIDVTLNLLTMFGLIVVLGLLVDDAIVVSENIQTMHDKGTPSLIAAVTATRQVMWPVVATVLTSIVAFLPLTFIRGQIGDLLGALPLVVACALAMSLVESLLILPSHMGHSLAKRDRSTPGRLAEWIRKGERWRDHLVHDRLIPAYAKVLKWCLHFRYISISAAGAILLISTGLFAGGFVEFVFLDKTDAETIVVDVRLPVGSSVKLTDAAVAEIEKAAAAQAETDNISSVIGQRSNIDTGSAEAFAPHVAQMFIELVYVENRERRSSEVVDSIREQLAGKIDEVERISFTEITGGPAGPDITVRVAGDDSGRIDAAVADLKQRIDGQPGVIDVSDDNDAGQLELQIRVNPDAQAQGFDQQFVAQQMRGSLFGIDAHVFADRQEDIDVRVRLDEDTRSSLHAIENSWLVSRAGLPVPLTEIATITEGQTYATIKRVNRRRTATITADVATDFSPESVVTNLKKAGKDGGLSPIDQVRAAYPDLTIKFAGRQEQMADAFGSLPYGFAAALLMIYVILAWLFSSYTQPILVLLAVPFAITGVLWGHFMFGFPLTFLSLIGFVALSGIVVNDSLILVQFFNFRRSEGVGVADALVAAGRARLRAILLTTITTVFGLLPLLLEQSFQARFLIPMAISIAVGLLSATVLILLVLPCFILILEDIKDGLYYLWHGKVRPATHAHEDTAPLIA